MRAISSSSPPSLSHQHPPYLSPSHPYVSSTTTTCRLDSRFGLFRCTVFRILLSQGLITLICTLLPFQPPDALGYDLLIASLVVLGLASGVAFGTSYRIVSKFPG